MTCRGELSKPGEHLTGPTADAGWHRSSASACRSASAGRPAHRLRMHDLGDANLIATLHRGADGALPSTLQPPDYRAASLVVTLYFLFLPRTDGPGYVLRQHQPVLWNRPHPLTQPAYGREPEISARVTLPDPLLKCKAGKGGDTTGYSAARRPPMAPSLPADRGQ